MVSLTLRNIPQSLLERVRHFARGERRSLNSELLVLLEEGVVGRNDLQSRSNGELPVIRVRTHLWNELCGGWQGGGSITSMIEEVLSFRSCQDASLPDKNASGSLLETPHDSL